MKAWRARRRACLGASIGLAACAFGLRAHSAGPGDRVELRASRFEFGSAEIVARRGRTLTIALASTDFVHGFAIPELGVRVDCPPGKTVEVTFVPARAGRFVFLCDNFCGEGHDRMHGVLIVTESGS